jgi:HAD superfamily hydrolase (TIGR01509 family)
MIKGIIFDIDGTLYSNVEQCYKAGLKGAHENVRDKISFRNFQKLYDESKSVIHKELPKLGVSHDRHLYFNLLVEKLIGKADAKLAMDLTNSYWNAYLEKMKPRKDIGFIRELPQVLGVATNLVTRIQLMKLEKLGLHDAFHTIVSTEESLYDKPNPRSLRICMKRMGVKPSNTLYVGDSKTDVEAGLKAGVKTAVFGGGDFPIKRLSDIQKVVKWLEK